MAGINFHRVTNPHPHPTDFAHEICIRQMRILAGSVKSLKNRDAPIRHWMLDVYTKGWTF